MRIWAVILVICQMVSAAQAEGRKVDTALVLALDESGSVNGHRWRVQLQGYAGAFRDKRVVDALLMKPTAITLVQWSGVHAQAQTIPWRLLDSETTIEAFVVEISKLHRTRYDEQTAIGNAIMFASALLQESGFEARRKVIDISGDGIDYVSSTDAYVPIELSVARAHAIGKGITINGLPIKVSLTEEHSLNKDIDVYYEQKVIGGPDAFIETVADGNDVGAFTRALVKKLVRELLADAR